MWQRSLIAGVLAVTGVGWLQIHSSARENIAAAAAEENSDQGKAIFDGPGNCTSCHRVGALGSVVASNLSDIGSKLSPSALKQLLLNPPRDADAADRLYVIVTRTGKTVRGKLLNQDPFDIQMLDSDGQLVAFQRSDIRDARFVDPPPMPSYGDKLTESQMADLVAYLESLRIPKNE
jgi:putative heme-binding domain-containing protein